MRKLKLEELGRVSNEEFKKLDKIPVVVVLDNIRSAMNVGSFFRTSDAFKVKQIILCGITAKPPHKEILKTAIGATKSVDWIHKEEIVPALEELKLSGYKIIGIEQTDASSELSNYVIDQTAQYALVFGNEVQGLNAACLPILDQAVELAQYGTKHSLNVSVCGGIVIWHFAKTFLT